MGDDWYRGIFMGVSSNEVILTCDTYNLTSVTALSIGTPKSVEEGIAFTSTGLVSGGVFAALLVQGWNTENDALYIASSYGLGFAGLSIGYGLYRLAAGSFNRLAGKGTYRIGQKWSIGQSYIDEPVLK